MIKVRESHIVDSKGHQVGVVLTNREYRKLLQKVEELEAIRAYDEAKASQDEAIPFAQARKEIERSRQ